MLIFFSKASGVDIGGPSTEFIEKHIPHFEKVIKLAIKLLKKYKNKIQIPTDVAININGKRNGINVNNLPQEYPLYDIGIDTLVNYIRIIEEVETIIANGPMGVFEDSEFAAENEVFRAISNSDGMTVVGGGEMQWHLTKWDWLMKLGIFQQEEVLVYLSWLEKHACS